MPETKALLQSFRVRGGYGALFLWALVTLILVKGPENLDGITLPFLVLPAVILAISGSVVAAYLVAAFFALDIVNSALQSPFNPPGVALHLGLLLLALQGLAVVRGRSAQARPPLQTDVPQPATPRSAATTEGASTVAGAKQPSFWRRLNLGLVVLALVLVLIAAAGMAAYILENGNMPWNAVRLSLVVTGILYSVAILLAVRAGFKRAFLIWLLPPVLLVAWFVVFSVACPACTWASR
jgi:hypothetical protein